MNTEIIEEVNKTLKKNIHIQKIIKKLSERSGKHGRSNMSLMVGSGMSKNCINGRVPDWGELIKCMYKELYPEKEMSSDNINYLKLAQEYEETFLRINLETFIKSQIPYQTIKPSTLHKKLLKLNWADVFTTNWDSLLEDAFENVRKYNVIKRVTEIPQYAPPRIVKLHGSLKDSTQLIFTEEDFRSYNRKYKPFINMIRQSLMETSFLLIGYSANDPDFLEWIGWVRDELKLYAPPLYMFGVLGLSEGKKNYFKKLNIKYIDLYELLPEIKNNPNKHNIAISGLLDVLEVGIHKHEDWLNGITITNWDVKPDSIKATIAELKKFKQSYNGWLIVPPSLPHFAFTAERMNHIRILPDEINNYPFNDCLELNALILWYYDKFLITYKIYFIQYQEILLDKISATEKKNQYDCYLIEIYKVLFKDARFYKKFEKFFLYEKKIREYLNEYKTSPETEQFLYYQKALFYLEILDHDAVREILNEWKLDLNLDLFWYAKKAMIHCYLDEVESALNLIKDALIAITISQSQIDVYYLSRYSYLLELRNLYEKAIEERKFYDIEKDNDFDWLLKEYHCEPYEQLKILENRVKPVFINKKRESDTLLGTWSRRIYSGRSINQEFRYFAFFEETAFPLKVKGKEINYINTDIKNLVFVNLFKITPLLAFSNLVLFKSDNREAIAKLINREFLRKLSGNKKLLESVIENIFKILNNYLKENEYQHIDFLFYLLEWLLLISDQTVIEQAFVFFVDYYKKNYINDNFIRLSRDEAAAHLLELVVRIKKDKKSTIIQLLQLPLINNTQIQRAHYSIIAKGIDRILIDIIPHDKKQIIDCLKNHVGYINMENNAEKMDLYDRILIFWNIFKDDERKEFLEFILKCEDIDTTNTFRNFNNMPFILPFIADNEKDSFMEKILSLDNSELNKKFNCLSTIVFWFSASLNASQIAKIQNFIFPSLDEFFRLSNIETYSNQIQIKDFTNILCFFYTASPEYQKKIYDLMKKIKIEKKSPVYNGIELLSSVEPLFDFLMDDLDHALLKNDYRALNKMLSLFLQKKKFITNEKFKELYKTMLFLLFNYQNENFASLLSIISQILDSEYNIFEQTDIDIIKNALRIYLMQVIQYLSHEEEAEALDFWAIILAVDLMKLLINKFKMKDSLFEEVIELVKISVFMELKNIINEIKF